MIDTTLANMRPPAPFERLIDNHMDRRTCGDKGGDEQEEQHFTHLERGPACTTENMMEDLEARVVLQSHRPQGRSNRVWASREQGPVKQGQPFLPSRTSEPGTKGASRVASR